MCLTENKVAVIGSGLVGTVLAMGLKMRGFEVVVFDKSPDVRTIDFSGRSINLAISNRGWKTLGMIGVEQAIKKIAIPMSKRAIHKVGESLLEQPYGIKGESIYSISRGELNKKLVQLAEEMGVEFCFDTPVWDVDLDTGDLYTGESERGLWTKKTFKRVFGSDGAYSRVRLRMQRKSGFDYRQTYMHLGYKELVIEPDAEGKHLIDKNSFHIWPQGDFMLIALPNVDGTFTCTLFLSLEGENSFEKLKTEEEVVTFFKKYFPDAIRLIPDLLTDFFQNPTNTLVRIQCFPWVYKDKVALVGDAAHAVVPFYGQGLNAGLEDVGELLRLIDLHDDWKAILSQYQEIRKPNADAIAELSNRNFEEMSSHTADPMFLLRKKIETRFSKRYPDLWLPLYDRVTFSSGTYVEALRWGDFQNAIMDEVMRLSDIAQRWDSAEVEEYMLKLLKKVES